VRECLDLILFVLTDTAWYKLWVIDNAKHHKSTVAQVGEGFMRS
jgi:hypothetical protein